MSTLVISPARAIVRPGGALTFTASGGTGTGYVFSFATAGDNASGGTIGSGSGAYVAGSRAIRTDRVTVTDSGSNTAVALVDTCANLYRDYQSRLVRTGDWQGQRIKLLEQDLGGEKDIQFERARQAVLSNNPAKCPADALDVIGKERGLPRAASGESDAAYAERLRTCWDAADGWSFAGSHGGLLKALARAGFPQGDPAGAHIVQRVNLYSWLAAGVVTFGTHALWTFDGSPPGIWNQFGIIFGADVAGLSAGSASAAVLNQLVASWKPAKARYMGCWVIVSGTVWGWPPTAKWGDAGRLWSSATVRFIPPP